MKDALVHDLVKGSQQRPVVGRSPGTLAEVIALQEIEGNPLTSDEMAMFEMFDREGWSHEKRRAHIVASVKAEASYGTSSTSGTRPS